MANNLRPVRVGDIRPTQLMFSYGVGALLDMPRMSVVVLGLDEWNPDQCVPLSEDRLLAVVQKQVGPQVKRLLMPPASMNDNASKPFEDLKGVPVAPFPRWMRCPNCKLLAPVDSGLFKLKSNAFAPDRTAYVHETCPKAPGRAPNVLPIRFLMACKNGHLDDFPWESYVHRGRSPCKPSILKLREFGASGEPDEIMVFCETCKSGRSMVEAFGNIGKMNLPTCSGRHPHLAAYSDSCDEEVNRPQ